MPYKANIMLFDFAPTQYDIHFRVFGFPCRIHPLFWAIAFLLNLGWTGGLNPQYKAGAILVGIACVFVSILGHELGHAFLMRRAGFMPEIVLHAMGGHAAWGSQRRISPQTSIAIFFAGPAAGLLMYGLTVGIHRWLLQAPEQVPFLVRYALAILEEINLWWSLFNLLPIFPLDGGQIARTWMSARWGTRGLLNSLVVSIATCVGMILWSYQDSGGSFLSTPILFFVMFAVQNFQEYQFYGISRRW